MTSETIFQTLLADVWNQAEKVRNSYSPTIEDYQYGFARDQYLESDNFSDFAARVSDYFDREEALDLWNEINEPDR